MEARVNGGHLKMRSASENPESEEMSAGLTFTGVIFGPLSRRGMVEPFF
jgi:hypothetical protein